MSFSGINLTNSLITESVITLPISANRFKNLTNNRFFITSDGWRHYSLSRYCAENVDRRGALLKVNINNIKNHYNFSRKG
jgi:hypothetical protein